MMLRIGDFSKLSRVSIRMLRHYDKIGLLIPESVDRKYRIQILQRIPASGGRYYTGIKDYGIWTVCHRGNPE